MTNELWKPLHKYRVERRLVEITNGHVVKIDFRPLVEIDYLPREIFVLDQLQELRINCPKLLTIPKEIGAMKHLQVLHIHQCHLLEELPEEVFQLSQLRELKICGYQRVKKLLLPREINRLPKLKKLIMSRDTSITQLPKGIGLLSDLQELDLEGCSSMRCLPGEIGNLSNLVYLNLCSWWSLEHLPASLLKLEALEKLVLAKCKQLKEIPSKPGGGMLLNLKVLYLYNCSSLETLSKDLLSIPSLEFLNIRGCSKLTTTAREIGEYSYSLKTVWSDHLNRDELSVYMRLNLSGVRNLLLQDNKNVPDALWAHALSKSQAYLCPDVIFLLLKEKPDLFSYYTEEHQAYGGELVDGRQQRINGFMATLGSICTQLQFTVGALCWGRNRH